MSADLSPGHHLDGSVRVAPTISVRGTVVASNVHGEGGPDFATTPVRQTQGGPRHRGARQITLPSSSKGATAAPWRVLAPKKVIDG